jgi:predicted transcriptional regulator of viral defense system
LAFYGIIPEAVVQITSVTSLKTANFNNAFGAYSYKSVREDLMFGYDLKTLADGRTMQLAKPEKALLDLLYLYPFYNTATEIEELRLDEDYMQDEFNWELLQDYTKRFNNKTLERKVKLVTNIYSS